MLADLLLILGAGFIIVGAWWIYPPLALLVAGVCCGALAWAFAPKGRR